MSGEHRRLEYTRWAYAVLIGAVLFAYRGSLDLGFVFDDHKTVAASPLVRGWDALPAYVSPDYYRLSGDPVHWRPVATFSHLAVEQVAGSDPRAHHAASIALHAANACALHALLAAVAPGGALVGALAFALHPALSETVVCVTFRRDALVLAGLLAAFACAVRGGLWLFALALVQLFAVGAKETAAVFPVLVPVLVLALSPRPERARRLALGAAATCLAATALYLAARLRLEAHSPVVVDRVPAPPPPERLALALAHLRTYLQLIVFPWPLAPERPSLAPGVLSLVASGAAAAALALALIRGSSTVRAGLAWILLPLVPVLVFVPAATAERYVYVSAAGAALLLALGFERAAARLPDRRWALFAVLPMLALEARALQDQVSRWRDPITLWGASAAHFAESSRTHIGLADGHLRRRDLASAERHLRRALALYPASDAALRGLAQVLARAGRREEAARAYADLLARKPVDAPAISAERDSLLRPGPLQLR